MLVAYTLCILSVDKHEMFPRSGPSGRWSMISECADDSDDIREFPHHRHMFLTALIDCSGSWVGWSRRWRVETSAPGMRVIIDMRRRLNAVSLSIGMSRRWQTGM